MTTDKKQNEIINAWQSLIDQSVKANTVFLEESAKLFTAVLSKKTKAGDLFKVDTEVLNTAANNFIKLNITNTENLVNFGVNISRGLFSFIDVKKDDTDGNSNSSESNSDEPAANRPAPAASPATRNQINLSMKQGGQISTSFYLNSHNAFAQTGKFSYEDFIDEATGNKTGLAMLISPKEFILEPAKSLKVDISIDATGKIDPGKYTSTVKLEGMDNQEFDIVVTVAESVPAIKNIVVKKNPRKNK